MPKFSLVTFFVIAASSLPVRAWNRHMITESSCSCQCCKGNGCSLTVQGACDKSLLIMSCKDLDGYNKSALQNVTLDPNRSSCFNATPAVCGGYPLCRRTESDNQTTTVLLQATGRTYFYDPVVRHAVNVSDIEVKMKTDMKPCPPSASLTMARNCTGWDLVAGLGTPRSDKMLSAAAGSSLEIMV